MLEVRADCAEVSFRGTSTVKIQAIRLHSVNSWEKSVDTGRSTCHTDGSEPLASLRDCTCHPSDLQQVMHSSSSATYDRIHMRSP